VEWAAEGMECQLMSSDVMYGDGLIDIFRNRNK